MTSKYSQTAINSLHKYTDIVHAACINDGGVIELTDDSHKASTSLTKNRLAYHLDDMVGIQVHTKVRALYYHINSRYRLRKRSKEFEGLIEHLEDKVAQYRYAKSKLREVSEYAAELTEIVIEINDYLVETSAMYHQFINNTVATTADIDVRIMQTEKCKRDIVHFNSIFEHLRVSRIAQWTQHDRTLSKILQRQLNRCVDLAIRELGAINTHLIGLLDRLNKEKSIRGINRLIDAFCVKYDNNPDFTPSILSLPEGNVPSCFAATDRGIMPAYADLDAQRDKELLMDCAVKAIEQRPSRTQEAPPDPTEPISDSRSTSFEVRLHPLLLAVEQFFEALKKDSVGVLSARDAYRYFALDNVVSDFMLLVDGYYQSQRKPLDRTFLVEYTYIPHPLYTGNTVISDIRFVRRVATMAG